MNLSKLLILCCQFAFLAFIKPDEVMAGGGYNTDYAAIVSEERLQIIRRELLLTDLVPHRALIQAAAQSSMGTARIKHTTMFVGVLLYKSTRIRMVSTG